MRMECRDKSVDKLFKRRSKIDIPEYQRDKVWSQSKKQSFIDTILKGWHVPKLYFRLIDKDEQSFECVDGQQRLNAVFEFYENKLSLSEKGKILYGGITYRTLKTEYSDRFDDYEFQVEEIEDASEPELEELFRRLQLGMPLNTAEKLNAIGGELRDFVKKLAQHDFFTKAISVKDTRFAHFVICCRFLYLEIYKVPARLRQSELEKMLNDNKQFSKSSTVAKKVGPILDILYEIFRPTPKVLTNRANVVSCYYLLSQFKDLSFVKKNVHELQEFFTKFFTLLSEEVEKGSKAQNKDLLDYQDAISRNTDSKEAINKRNDILLKYLSLLKPLWFPKINLSKDNKVTLVSQLVIQMFELIASANELYTAKSGDQKFKLTSDNIRANEKLKKLISDEKDFGQIIDSLYKLLYEGSANGARLNDSNNESLTDVKLFRTDLRHDWEHGKPRDIKKKAEKISDTYFKYSGKTSLSLLDELDLNNLQFALYTKLVEFLKGECS